MLFGLVTPIELCASLLGVVSVWLTIKQNIWCWPTGIVMVGLYAWIFYDAKLYSDFGLQLCYELLQIWGWWAWLRGGPRESPLPVQRMRLQWFLPLVAAALLAAAALGTATDRLTDADFAYADATQTVLSLVAQAIMARKVLQCWWLWIAVDLISVPLYAAKGLYFTAGLYALFLVLAVLGLRTWMRDLRKAAA